MTIVDERETQKTTKIKERKELGRTEAIMQWSEPNDFVDHLS